VSSVATTPAAAISSQLAPIERALLERPSPDVAPDLLGLILVHDTDDGLTGGVIVEAEAYAGPEDRASHARAGRTRRTAPMFGPAGHAYVYLIYGMHHCLNVVTETEGRASAVLLRAILPTTGLEAMRRRRGRPQDPDTRLGSGPARLSDALAIDLRQDGADLVGGGPLRLLRPPDDWPLRGDAIIRGTRVGVESAGPPWSEKAWRFGVAGSPALSRPFRSRVPSR
jgi:DNA-3-methyladenine glycosylase